MLAAPSLVRRLAPTPLAAALLLVLVASAAEGAPAPAQGDARPSRVVSLYPSITETLLALGAEDALVGVDEASAELEPRVRDLPRVGGLFNPSLEAIVGLAPSFVALVPSAQQRSLQARLEALGIEVLALPNQTLEQVLRWIEVLGERVGRAESARERIAAIREAWRGTRLEAEGRPSPRTVIVIQRDPLYVVGGGSFLDSMLSAAGATNVAAQFAEPYPRVSVEWLIGAAPELILDAADLPQQAADYWARWDSLPAVARGRVVSIAGQRITFPGPYLDRALRRLAAAVHPRGDAR